MSCAEQPCQGNIGVVLPGPNAESNEPSSWLTGFQSKVPGQRYQANQPGAVYLRKMLFNPFNLYLVLALTAFGLITGNIAMLPIALCAEVLVLAFVPRTKLFRAHIDESFRELERAAAARAREALLLQLSDTHRQELERLENLVEGIRENARRHGNVVQLVLDEKLELDRLCQTYIRLAIAHKERSLSLAMFDRQRLADNIRALELMDSACPNTRMSRLLQRRLAIGRKHLDHWDRTREQLDVISQQLATITALIQLLHAQSATPSGSQEMSDEIDHFMLDFKENEGTLRELAEFSADG